MTAMALTVVAVVMGMTFAVKVVMLMGMAVIMAMRMGMGMAVGVAIVGMLVGMGMLMGMLMGAAKMIMMNMHCIRSFAFFYIIIVLYADVKAFIFFPDPP